VTAGLEAAAERLVPPPPETATTFPVLDTLRAVGAICVVTTHVAFWSGDYTGHGVVSTLLARLDVGVAIFFVLSGFLLSRAWLVAAADGGSRPAVGRYFWKRMLRITPPYVIAVVLALTFVHANDDLSAGRWASTLLMLETYRFDTFPAGLTQMWSLAVEVAFYIVLPLLMFVLVGRHSLSPRRVVGGLLMLCAVSVGWHLAWAGHVGQGQPLEWLPAFLTWFAGGIFLAHVDVLHRRGRRTRMTDALVALARQPGSCWVVVAGLMLVAATPLAGPVLFAAPTPAESLTKHLLYAAIGFFVVLTGVFAVPGSRYTQLMGHPLCRRLGWISYSIFCFHLPALHLVMWLTGWELFAGRGVQIWLLGMGFTLVAAELCYRFVERPALRLKGLGMRTGRAAPRRRALNGTTIR
jgi:peptidoglycan/LPS O-acetylase OafA/YrhL